MAKKKSHYTSKLLLLIFAVVISMVVFVIGICRSIIWLELKNGCKSEITGVVDEVTTRFISSLDDVETRYLDNGEDKTKIHISIKPNGVFKRESIYTNPTHNETVRSEVVIHYLPKSPDNYYINDWQSNYRKTGIFTAAAGAVFVLLTILLVRLHKSHFIEELNKE